jgi:hypothetical protein
MKYSDIAGSRRLVLPGLLLVLSAAGATAEPGAVADRLGEALAGQGWSRVQAADGSVLYNRLPAAAEAPVLAEAPAESATAMADQLRRQLETAGWTQTVAPDGSVIYQAPGVAEPTAPADRDTPESSPAQQLQHALGTAGWREIHAEDGSVYYLPPARPAVEQPAGVATPDADAASAAAESRAVADRQVQTPTAAHAGPAVAGGLAAQFQDALSAYGWVRFEAADGSVIYRKSPASAGSGTGYGQQTLADDLRAQMEDLGWVGAVATDGSMVYWPPGEAVDGAGTAMATGAEVSRPPGARTRGVPRAAIPPHGCCQGWRQWSHPAPPAWQHAPWVIPRGRFWQR